MQTACERMVSSFVLIITSVVLGISVCAYGHQPWLGKWESLERNENFEAFFAALGPTAFNYGTDKLWNTFWNDGEKYHHNVSSPDNKYVNIFDFKLGDQESCVFSNTDFGRYQCKYFEDGNDILAQIVVPSLSGPILDRYHIDGDTLTKTHTFGDVSARRWYKKVPTNS